MKRQTKSKAIEAALQAGKHRHSLRYDPKAVADHAYDLGRIDGLLWAAKIVEPPPDNPCVDADEYAIAKDWLQEAATRVSNRADVLANKARSK